MSLGIIIIAVLASGVIGLALAMKIVFASKSTKTKKRKVLTRKDKAAILKNSNRKLAQNPKDAKALAALSDLYFNDGDYEKAKRTLSILEELSHYNRNLDRLDITKKYAISLLKTDSKEDAYRELIKALSFDPGNFEINFNLGVLEYQQKRYNEAINCLRTAKNRNSNHIGTIRYLGLSFYKLHRYREALAELRRALDANPDDKEILFAIGQSYNAIGNKEQALKIFYHLRTEPDIGAMACLYAGGVHLQNNQTTEALNNFEMGLKHKNVPPDILLELKYRTSAAYLAQQNFVNAINILKELNTIAPNYKDVSAQIQKYATLVANKNLSVFLLSGSSEFANLCRKVAGYFFPEAEVKIIDISITQNQYLDIVANINTRKWEDLVVFRFIRSTGQVSDLIIRELYSKIKEERAGRGVCMTAGNFTDEAKSFVEARLIDLIERADLEKILKKIEPEIL